MADFTSILSKKAAVVEKPKPKPPGNYMATVVGMPKQREVKFPNQEELQLALGFSIRLQAPHSGVDTDLLSEHDEVHLWPPFSHDVFISGEQGEWNLRRFLEQVLKIEPGDKSLGEMVTEAPGKQLIVTLINKPYMTKDGQPEIATNIQGVAAI